VKKEFLIPREAVQGVPAEISRGMLMASLHPADQHYNLCRVHEAHQTTPAFALGIAIGSGRLANCWTPR